MGHPPATPRSPSPHPIDYRHSTCLFPPCLLPSITASVAKRLGTEAVLRRRGGFRNVSPESFSMSDKMVSLVGHGACVSAFLPGKQISLSAGNVELPRRRAGVQVLYSPAAPPPGHNPSVSTALSLAGASDQACTG